MPAAHADIRICHEGESIELSNQVLRQSQRLGKRLCRWSLGFTFQSFKKLLLKQLLREIRHCLLQQFQRLQRLYGVDGLIIQLEIAKCRLSGNQSVWIAFSFRHYPLAVSQPSGRALLEVYPNPALIELASADRRLPYKHSKSSKYWPDVTPAVRRENLLETWRRIVTLLDARIEGVGDTLSLPSSNARGFEMKGFEDTLDAVVCAWVGACVMDGRARAYGDFEPAIWVPTHASLSPTGWDSRPPLVHNRTITMPPTQ